MKKIAFVVIPLVIIILAVACLIAFNGYEKHNATITFNSDRVCYEVGEEFDKNATVTINYKNGKTVTKKVYREHLLNFSTDEASAQKTATIKYRQLQVDFNYSVCNKVELPQNDSTIYSDLRYGSLPIHTFDLYLPKTLSSLDKDTKVMLYVHGGGWMTGDKTENRDSFIKRVADEEGMMIASMNYTLGNDSDGTGYNMLNEINMMMGYLSKLMAKMGLNANKIAISGYSAGAHLATWYAYSKKTTPIDIAYVVDMVGPVNVACQEYVDAFNKMINEMGLGVVISTMSRIICNMVSIPYVDLATVNIEELLPQLRTFCSVEYIDENSPPTIFAYGGGTGNEGFFKTTEHDSLVPVSNYYKIQEVLNKNNVPSVGMLFADHDHMDIAGDPDSMNWILSQIRAYNDLYL